MSVKLLRVSAGLALLFASSLGARAAPVVTLDFDPLYVANSSYAEVSVGSPYTEDGYQITGPYLGASTAADLNGTPRPAFQGSAALHSQSRGTMTLTKLDAGAFDLQSVDYAHSGNAAMAKTLNVIGLLVGGQSVSQTVDLLLGLDNADFPGFRTLQLNDSFRNLESVRFEVVSSFSSIKIDNVVLADHVPSLPVTVPEPASWALVMGALAMAGLARRQGHSAGGA